MDYGFIVCGLQGYLAHQKQRHPRTLQKGYAQGSRVVLGGWAVSYERGAPVGVRKQRGLDRGI